MKVDKISAGASPPYNEDAVTAYVHNVNSADLWVIDGASSIANQNYIDLNEGDPAWFVRNLEGHLKKVVTLQQSPEQIINQAILDLGKKFKRYPNSATIPIYAKPIAAITWVRIVGDGNGKISLDVYALGDCKVLMEHGGTIQDLDPYVNPQEAILTVRIQALQAEGVTDSTERRKKLLPMLQERREAQNTAKNPSVLCLEPERQFDARKYSYEAQEGALILMMTDGFYRLVDTYGIFSDRELIHACTNEGLNSVLKKLRNFEEQESEASRVKIKKADDATALLCILM